MDLGGASVCACLRFHLLVGSCTVGPSEDSQRVANGTSLRAVLPGIEIVAPSSHCVLNNPIRIALCVAEDLHVSRRKGRQDGCDENGGALHDFVRCFRSQYRKNRGSPMVGTL
jgi:hypothetical protein